MNIGWEQLLSTISRYFIKKKKQYKPSQLYNWDINFNNRKFTQNWLRIYCAPNLEFLLLENNIEQTYSSAQNIKMQIHLEIWFM